MCKAGNILSDLAQGKSVWGYLYSNEAVSYTHLDVYKRQVEKEDKLMIKKIAIVPYVTNGRNSQVGHDGHFNIFKKRDEKK